MRNIALALALWLGWAGASAAQISGTPIDTPPVTLPPEKQEIVREHVRKTKVPVAEVKGDVTVGMMVPESVELWALPQDSVTEVPTVTSYKFFMSGGVIAVVKPENRQVIQVIRN